MISGSHTMRITFQWLAAIALSMSLTGMALAQVKVNVVIDGVPGEIADNVRLFLSIEQQKNDVLLSEGRLHRLHEKSTVEINRALQPFGYYQPTIKKSLKRAENNGWVARYTIDTGPGITVHILDIKLTGDITSDPEFQSYMREIPLHVGDRFNHIVYDGIKSELARLAAERGYFSAQFTDHRVEIDLEEYEVNVYLHFDGGNRYRFGKIITQQDVLVPDLFQRYIPFEQGTPYTLNLLLSLQQALTDSDYFQTVEVYPLIAESQNYEIPITINLTPRKERRYTLGLGYGTDTGARTKLGWESPRINRNGHRFNAEARYSEIGYSLSARYRVPAFNPRTDQVIYSTGVVNEKTATSSSTVRSVSASLLRSRNAWRESLSLSYQKETFAIANDRGRSNLLIPGTNWNRVWGKDFINTLDGLRFDIGFKGASQHIASDTSFFQAQGSIKTITPLGDTNRIILRGQLGSTWSQGFNELPSSLRFFAGGTQSVRGYRFQSLGPADADGNIIGGRYLMTGSIELEHSFNTQWGVAVFYDAGNAFDNLDDKLERGSGLGFRWRSPIGPVRFDYASAISRDGKPWRIQINIGPDL